jgi:hypothetical protein
VKALTIQNPWAWCIARAAVDPEAKTIENRGWPTAYRGDLLIHAGRRVDTEACDHPLIMATALRWSGYPRHPAPAWVPPWEQGVGAVLAVATLVDDACGRRGMGCRCGPWAVPGQYHWRLSNVRQLAEPVPARGAQGLWTPPPEVEAAVREQLAVPA